MLKIHQKFTAHPVGQGLFYSGVITAYDRDDQASKFKLVFDCGSDTLYSGEEEAKAFNQEYLRGTGNKIGLLVISHFHEDHVNLLPTLLAGKARIEKLVLPFASFEERLFLAWRHIVTATKAASVNPFYLAFVMDPLGYLDGFLDVDSIVYIITDGPDGGNYETEDFPADLPERGSQGFEFDFDKSPDNRAYEDQEEIRVLGSGLRNGRLRVVKDSVKGHLYGPVRGAALMEFIFYRKSAGIKEKGFYKLVREKFSDHVGVAKGMSPEEAEVMIADWLKEKFSTKDVVDKTYGESLKIFPVLDIKSGAILKMNVVSLSMLHLNLKNAYHAATQDKPFSFPAINGWAKTIQKLDGSNKTRIESGLPVFHRMWPWLYRAYYYGNQYPNCLLTSDSCLKTKADVAAFYGRYWSYWTRFWLFQVPHHGSSYNSSKTLFLNLDTRVYRFINYGINHKKIGSYRHPSAKVLKDLTAASQSGTILAVNEFTGFSYGCWI